MDHPLLEDANRELRKRVIQLFQLAYSLPRGSNVIFVCGGNDDGHMRPKFRDYCAENLKEFEIFFPESAMKEYFSSEISKAFDVSKFETLVGELSHAIVIFPEAPGSFAETGYFSAFSNLSRKTILALDAPRQKHDSFISMGPAKTIGNLSIFQPNIQMDYASPNFDWVVERIRRIERTTRKKAFEVDKFSNISTYDLFSLIQKIVSILSVATLRDVVYILKSIFKTGVSELRVRQLIAILVGVGYLRPVGNYGHYFIPSEKVEIFTTRSGYIEQEADIRVQLFGIYEIGDSEFRDLVDEAADNAD